MQQHAVSAFSRCWARQSRAKLSGAAVGLAIVLVGAGCGASSSPGRSKASPKAGAGTVDVEYISDLSGTNGQETPFLTAMKAAVAAANARGGIEGRKIALTVCDSQVSDQADATCGQAAVSDHAIAVIGNEHEDAGLPYLQKAAIPYLNEGFSAGDWSSPVSFMINNLGVAASVGFVAVLKQDGCTSFAALNQAYSVSPSSAAAFNAAIGAGAKQDGLTYDGPH